MIQISWTALSWTCTSIPYLVLLSVALSLLYSTLYHTVHMTIPWLCSPYFDFFKGYHLHHDARRPICTKFRIITV